MHSEISINIEWPISILHYVTTLLKVGQVKALWQNSI